MGSIAKALRRLDYDLGLNKLGDYLEGERKKKEQAETYKTITDAVNEYQQSQKLLEGGVELNKGGEVFNPFSPKGIGTLGAPGETPGFNLKTNIPENIQGQIVPTAPETQTRAIPQNEKYQRAQGNLQDFLNALIPTTLNPETDQAALSKINVLAQLFSKQADRFKPKEVELQSFNPEHNIYEKGTGKLIREGVNKPSTKRAEQFKVSEDGYYMYWDENEDKFVKTAEKAPEKDYKRSSGGGTTINMPGLPMDTSSLQSSLTTRTGNYKHFDGVSKEAAKKLAGMKPTDPGYGKAKADYETAEEQKSIYMNQITGDSDALANKLNSKYPGFEKIYNLSFQNPELKALQSYKPKDADESQRKTKAIQKAVDKYIEEVMGEADDDTKRWMKKLLKSRVF